LQKHLFKNGRKKSANLLFRWNLKKRRNKYCIFLSPWLSSTLCIIFTPFTLCIIFSSWWPTLRVIISPCWPTLRVILSPWWSTLRVIISQCSPTLRVLLSPWWSFVYFTPTKDLLEHNNCSGCKLETKE